MLKLLDFGDNTPIAMFVVFAVAGVAIALVFREYNQAASEHEAVLDALRDIKDSNLGPVLVGTDGAMPATAFFSGSLNEEEGHIDVTFKLRCEDGSKNVFVRLAAKRSPAGVWLSDSLVVDMRHSNERLRYNYAKHLFEHLGAIPAAEMGGFFENIKVCFLLKFSTLGR